MGLNVTQLNVSHRELDCVRCSLVVSCCFLLLGSPLAFILHPMPATFSCHSFTLTSPLAPPTEAFKAAQACQVTPAGAHQKSGQLDQAYLFVTFGIDSARASIAVGS